MTRSITFFLLLFCVGLIGYSFFSYSLTDPNLVITSWNPYWQFQQWMWKYFFHNRLLLVITYTSLLTILWISFSGILAISKLWSIKKIILLYVVFMIPLLFSYNALSHDVFNYMFNAKMVLVYQDNPHLSVALDYPQDEWIRFMHNTHTPAPYGYGWTILSLIPFLLGLGKFLTTWLAFRIFAVISLLLLWITLVYVTRKNGQKINLYDLSLVFFNPLLLIEVISNMHNDLWMIVPALFSLGLLLEKKETKTSAFLPKILLSAVLLLASISIKLATVVLVPIWLMLFLEKISFSFKTGSLLRHWQKIGVCYWPLWSSLLLFLPLLSPRSKQFLPWYLIWVLIWLPLMKSHPKFPFLNLSQSIWKKAIMVLSIAVSFRYLPWLWQGDFSGQVELYQKSITWLPFLITLVFLSIKQLAFKK